MLRQSKWLIISSIYLLTAFTSIGMDDHRDVCFDVYRKEKGLEMRRRQTIALKFEVYYEPTQWHIKGLFSIPVCYFIQTIGLLPSLHYDFSFAS